MRGYRSRRSRCRCALRTSQSSVLSSDGPGVGATETRGFAATMVAPQRPCSGGRPRPTQRSARASPLCPRGSCWRRRSKRSSGFPSTYQQLFTVTSEDSQVSRHLHHQFGQNKFFTGHGRLALRLVLEQLYLTTGTIVPYDWNNLAPVEKPCKGYEMLGFLN